MKLWLPHARRLPSWCSGAIHSDGTAVRTAVPAGQERPGPGSDQGYCLPVPLEPYGSGPADAETSVQARPGFELTMSSREIRDRGRRTAPTILP
jgi:hypothetical protein